MTGAEALILVEVANHGTQWLTPDHLRLFLELTLGPDRIVFCRHSATPWHDDLTGEEPEPVLPTPLPPYYFEFQVREELRFTDPPPRLVDLIVSDVQRPADRTAFMSYEQLGPALAHSKGLDRVDFS